MRFSLAKTLVLALAGTEIAVASSWFGKAAYNKWHETELERWLSDNDVPYPTPADRKDLESLVKDNWQAKVVEPLSVSGNKVDDHYGSVKSWIFDSWTESSLKAFLDHHNIPNPQPRSRDKLLTSARQNYDAIAKKAGEYAAYPGDWLYHSWSESDLKEFLDSRGLPAPQPSTRDKLIASVRRNARLASLQGDKALSSASKSAASATDGMAASASSAQAGLSDAIFDAWSDSKLKEFLDEHGIPVPQGSKKNELIALARKNRASLTGNAASTASGSAASAYEAATSSAGNAFAKGTDVAAATASDAADSIFHKAIDTWSDSRLKAFLDARGVPVPQSGKKDELIAAVRKNQYKASTGWSAWTFDTWTTENLQKYLDTQGKKAKKGAQVNRDELLKQAQDSYASASKSGGTAFASITNYLTKQTDSAKDSVFDSWSDSDLKAYLDSYGIPNYQGSTTNELRAEAKKQYNYFKYGTSSPSGNIFAQLGRGVQWLIHQVIPPSKSIAAEVSGAAVSASGQAAKSLSSASVQASKSASSASVQASKSASSASVQGSKSASSASSSASKAAASSASSVKNEL